MDNHPVPRSVTTFEFKLIGWFTVKEFIYLLIAIGIAVIFYFTIPVPYVNIAVAGATVGLGAFLVMYKYNERPLDIWAKNLVFRLLSPSQYFWHKDNPAPDFLSGVTVSDSIIVSKHLDASSKLQSYVDSSGASTPTPSTQASTRVEEALAPQSTPTQQNPDSITQPSSVPQETTTQQVTDHTPYISGIIQNSKSLPLPNIMVYVNTHAGELVRILKTNKNGIFASFHPLEPGTYIISPKDLGGNYFFDTMTVPITGPLEEPVRITSKELL